MIEWLINTQSNGNMENQANVVNALDNNGKTPLHVAAEKGKTPLPGKVRQHSGFQVDLSNYIFQGTMGLLELC